MRLLSASTVSPSRLTVVATTRTRHERGVRFEPTNIPRCRPRGRQVIQTRRLESDSRFTLSRATLAMRAAPAIKLSDSDRLILERWSRGRSTPARLVLRANIVLLAAQGKLNTDIAHELRCGTKTVCLWRQRFFRQGVAGIEKDAPRGGKRTEQSAALAQQIIHKTLHESPPRRSRWSTRTLAAVLGTSPAMVQRVWKANGLTASQGPSASTL